MPRRQLRATRGLLCHLTKSTGDSVISFVPGQKAISVPVFSFSGFADKYCILCCTFAALLLGIDILMAHMQNHDRHLSDSSLLVSCLRHSGVLPAAPVSQVRYSSLPAYTTSPFITARVLLAEAHEGDCPAITLTTPPTEGGTAVGTEVVLGKGKEKEHDASKANGAGFTVVCRRNSRGRGQGNQYPCLHEAIHIGATASLAGPEKSEFGNASTR